MAEAIKGLRGMNDILPEDAAQWQRFEAVTARLLQDYGYRQIRTPLLEQTGLFRRSIGAATDIVEKEMYTFVDGLNGEQLTLRPEATASTVRAVIEHNLLYNGPQRLWYSGPMFRHERPQQGRYRQFHQIGAEALGFAGPDVDVEMLVMCARLWRELGIAEAVSLDINSLGDASERARHRDELVAYLERHRETLDADSQRRLTTNPLRVLDSKNPAMQTLIAAAPRLLDFLGTASQAHFDALRAGLEASGIPYRINPRLVRGLDYYNLTVFEWVTERLGAQGTVCGGGRYDGLIEQIGGKPAPGLGFAMGVERLLALMAEMRVPLAAAAPDAYVIHHGEAATRLALGTAERLRDAGLAVVMHCGGGNFKAQMKKADASSARVAVILGDDEALAGEASVKPLRKTGEQIRVKLDSLAEHVRGMA